MARNRCSTRSSKVSSTGSAELSLLETSVPAAGKTSAADEGSAFSDGSASIKAPFPSSAGNDSADSVTCPLGVACSTMVEPAEFEPLSTSSPWAASPTSCGASCFVSSVISYAPKKGGAPKHAAKGPQGDSGEVVYAA